MSRSQLYLYMTFLKTVSLQSKAFISAECKTETTKRIKWAQKDHNLQNWRDHKISPTASTGYTYSICLESLILIHSYHLYPSLRHIRYLICPMICLTFHSVSVSKWKTLLQLHFCQETEKRNITGFDAGLKAVMLTV